MEETFKQIIPEVPFALEPTALSIHGDKVSAKAGC
jgi:hypothetical protein